MKINDQLLSYWKREKAEQGLTELDPDFYEKCREYVTHLERQSENEQNKVIAKLFNKRWTRINYIVNDLVTLRLNKLVNALINGDDIDIILPLEEEELVKKLQSQLSLHRDKILGIETEQPQIASAGPSEDGYALVQFTQKELLVFIGADLKEYGPFEVDDIAVIPRLNMRNLQLRSKVEEIEID